MTELMKRYETETGECATWTWHEREFLTDDYIAWLESQLRWRPVSEVTESGWYTCRHEPSVKRFCAFYDARYGTWNDDNFRYRDPTHCISIPPAPEGE